MLTTTITETPPTEPGTRTILPARFEVLSAGRCAPRFAPFENKKIRKFAMERQRFQREWNSQAWTRRSSASGHFRASHDTSEVPTRLGVSSPPDQTTGSYRSLAFPQRPPQQEEETSGTNWLGQLHSRVSDYPPSIPPQNSPFVSNAVAQRPMTPLEGSASTYSPHEWYGSFPGPTSFGRPASEDANVDQISRSHPGASTMPGASSIHDSSYPRRHRSHKDEFDGPSQLLEKPDDNGYEPKEEDLPQLPITLHAQEQDEILSKVNDRLSQCAFSFVAKYQFPIPIEADKRPVRIPADREWSEWVYLLKRLATKRRIPARVLYHGQIKQLITILENSLEMRHAAKHQSRPLKDDRNILQLISSGLQVAKILKDAPAMQYLDALYVHTERLIQSRLTYPPSSLRDV